MEVCATFQGYASPDLFSSVRFSQYDPAYVYDRAPNSRAQGRMPIMLHYVRLRTQVPLEAVRLQCHFHWVYCWQVSRWSFSNKQDISPTARLMLFYIPVLVVFRLVPWYLIHALVTWRHSKSCECTNRCFISGDRCNLYGLEVLPPAGYQELEGI